jgi:hypothetical protein
MTRHQADELRALAKSYPVPNDDKLKRRMGRLERMARFYEEKAVDAPEKQSQMFIAFFSALLYAQDTIKTYRRLTTRLAELAAEGDDNE